MMTRVKLSKHQKMVDELYCRLKQKPYVHEIYKNIEYSRGELDILYRCQFRWVYYEFKGRDTNKTYDKAKLQTSRFTKNYRLIDIIYDWMNRFGNPRITRYGIYYHPGLINIPKRLSKDGKYIY